MESNSNNIKLAAAVLLLTEGTHVMRTSLNKQLFFADITHFLNGSEKSTITDSHYRKLPYGPVPDAIDWVRSSLIRDGYLRESVHTNGNGYYQYQYTATEQVDFIKVRRQFTDTAKAIITNVKQNLGSLSASELSNESHKYEPWKSASMNEILDFNKALQDNELRQFLRQKHLLASIT